MLCYAWCYYVVMAMNLSRFFPVKDNAINLLFCTCIDKKGIKNRQAIRNHVRNKCKASTADANILTFTAEAKAVL